MTENYNGWHGGYNTWLVALWVGNEPYWYERLLCIKESLDLGGLTDEELEELKEKDLHKYMEIIDTLADEIMNSVEDNKPKELNEASMYSDLFNSAVGEIDWREIAESYLED